LQQPPAGVGSGDITPGQNLKIAVQRQPKPLATNEGLPATRPAGFRFDRKEKGRIFDPARYHVSAGWMRQPSHRHVVIAAGMARPRVRDGVLNHAAHHGLQACGMVGLLRDRCREKFGLNLHQFCGRPARQHGRLDFQILLKAFGQKASVF
jgi:hypothetical protein